MGNTVSTSGARLAGLSNLVGEVGNDVQYEKSMGSSRFLKAIRARHRHGPIVVKTFIKPDPGFSLRNLVRRLRVEREALADVPNVLTYQKVVETEKAGYLIRQWLASNLYDRISTRPFLTTIEKKWITYQLLYAMRDSRGRKIPHGDLKCENILVTTSLMVYVTDFAASFKPAYLPLDDPADFSFFFDTSGRRTCYVAPERFYEADSEIAKQKAAARLAGGTFPMPSDVTAAGALGRATIDVPGISPAGFSSDPYMDILGLGKRDGKVTEAMDVFSLGCVIAELWRDGSPTFTLSQLFKYRENNFDVEVALAEIADSHVRDMVRSMISLDPKDRKTFDQYLVEGYGRAFPASFYVFFHQYLVELQRTPAVALAKGETGTIPSSPSGPSNASSAAPSVSGRQTSGATGVGDNSTSTTSRLESDERVEQLYEEWSKIVTFFDDKQQTDEDKGASNLPFLSDPLMLDAYSMDGGDREGAERVIPVQLNIPGLQCQSLDADTGYITEDGTALIILSVILANLRNCLRPSSKCHALDLLLHLSSRWLSDETKLDRVIPFVISLLDDESVQVRMAAVRACTQLLMLVKVITPSNASIFPEYIMPNIKGLSLDPSTAVRCVYASCLVPLAKTGERYLQMAQAMKAEGLFAVERDLTGDFLDSQPDESNYDAQLQLLQNVIQEQVTTLLTDPSAAVKRSLLSNIAPLCNFYGKAKTNDVLLSHMITYLNDRNWLLREAFFETIVGVAPVAGERSLEEYILPLMTQALSDTEEFVVVRVLNGLTRLVEGDLFRKAKILDLLSSTVGFLCHPNLWIREAAAGFVAMSVTRLNATEVWSIVYPSIRPLLKSDIHEITELNLLDGVRRPLPRPVFQAAVLWASKASKTSFWRPSSESKGKVGLRNGLGTEGIGLLLGKTGRTLRQTTIARSEEDDGYLDKLRTLGMENEDEVKLVALRDYIWKVAKHSSGSLKSQSSVDFDVSAPLLVADSSHHLRPGLEVQTLEGITPQTIFFSTNPDTSSAKVNYPDGCSIPAGTFRSQHDGSFSGKVARRRLAGQRIVSDGSWLGPSEEIRRRIVSNSSTYTMSPIAPMESGEKLLSGAQAPPNPTGVQRPTSPVASSSGQARLGLGKAPAAIASSHLNATGTMTELAAKLRSLDAGPRDSSSRVTPAGSTTQTARERGQAQLANEGPSFSSTYDGNDPYIRAHLEAIFLKSFRDRPEFGPRVHAGPPRRRGARSALPSGPKSSSSSSNRRPEGNLIAYFTEHTGPITSVAVSPDHLFFVSGSEDGTSKVWDTARLEKNVTSRSRATYSAQKGAITAVIALEGSHCIASTATDGSLHVWRVGLTHGSSIPRYSKPKLVSNFQLSTPGEYATCLIQLSTETTSNLILGTSHARLTVLDLRTMQVLQTLRNPIQYGPITCMCADKRKSWLLVGTLGGVVSLWDLRFGLLLRSWRVGTTGSRSTADFDAGEPLSGGLLRVNRCALHPSKGKGRWVLIASERVAPTTTRSPHRGGTHVPKATETLVETWDIDRGVRVETFETGPFPKPASASQGVSQQENGRHDEEARDAMPSSIITSEAPADDTMGPAAAIERLLRERQRVERNEARDGADDKEDEKRIQAVEEKATDEELEEEELVLKATGERCSVRALHVSLEGYSSSSIIPNSSGQMTGGWLDAGKLAAEADGEGSQAAAKSSSTTTTTTPTSGAAGFMISAGEDRKIRFWDLGRVEKGVCIGTVEEKSEFKSFSGPCTSSSSSSPHSHAGGGQQQQQRPIPAKGAEDTGAGRVNPPASSSTSSSSSPSPTPTTPHHLLAGPNAINMTRHVHQLHVPSSSRPQMRSPLLAHPQTQHANALSRVHRDAITAIVVIEHPFRAIVAGDRSGCIRVWE
ncbi:hypothetical protein IE53DRAFT_312700 [Violaceomyces palustris]|uniref:Uncharacterized protein n=1 Tax=Violaceomyces palustris TaxID=1673888 RepID=A0ACD0P282_9BASI|nr:hypothetical protein IE53DRAFT_312700 [Violaceomyces palustris]